MTCASRVQKAFSKAFWLVELPWVHHGPRYGDAAPPLDDACDQHMPLPDLGPVDCDEDPLAVTDNGLQELLLCFPVVEARVGQGGSSGSSLGDLSCSVEPPAPLARLRLASLLSPLWGARGPAAHRIRDLTSIRKNRQETVEALDGVLRRSLHGHVTAHDTDADPPGLYETYALWVC